MCPAIHRKALGLIRHARLIEKDHVGVAEAGTVSDRQEFAAFQLSTFKIDGPSDKVKGLKVSTKFERGSGKVRALVGVGVGLCLGLGVAGFERRDSVLCPRCSPSPPPLCTVVFQRRAQNRGLPQLKDMSEMGWRRLVPVQNHVAWLISFPELHHQSLKPLLCQG